MSLRHSTRPRKQAEIYNVSPEPVHHRGRGHKRAASASPSARSRSRSRSRAEEPPQKKARTASSTARRPRSQVEATNKKQSSSSKKGRGASAKKKAASPKARGAAATGQKQKSRSSSSSPSSSRSAAGRKGGHARARSGARNPRIQRIPNKATSKSSRHDTPQHSPQAEEKRMSHYSDKRKRQAQHIEESYEKRGMGEKKAKAIAFATVNKTRAQHGETQE